jgi:hypothetical protein
MSKTRLSILQHALGVDQYGQGRQYRSHYVAGPGSDCWELLNTMVTEGLLVRHEPSQVFGNDYCFIVTPVGSEYVLVNSPKPPKLTRSQQNYKDFLSADSGMPFGEWIKNRNKKATSW